MKKMYLVNFRYKDEEGNNHYDRVVAESFPAAIKAKYPDFMPNFEYVSSEEVDVVL